MMAVAKIGVRDGEDGQLHVETTYAEGFDTESTACQVILMLTRQLDRIMREAGSEAGAASVHGSEEGGVDALAAAMSAPMVGADGQVLTADEGVAAVQNAMYPPCPECQERLSRAKGPGNPLGRLHCANAKCGSLGLLLNHHTMQPIEGVKRLALVMPH
jgi:hypothetical protein